MQGNLAQPLRQSARVLLTDKPVQHTASAPLLHCSDSTHGRYEGVLYISVVRFFVDLRFMLFLADRSGRAV
jgi:hypothetical protein